MSDTLLHISYISVTYHAPLLNVWHTVTYQLYISYISRAAAQCLTHCARGARALKTHIAATRGLAHKPSLREIGITLAVCLCLSVCLSDCCTIARARAVPRALAVYSSNRGVGVRGCTVARE